MLKRLEENQYDFLKIKENLGKVEHTKKGNYNYFVLLHSLRHSKCQGNIIRQLRLLKP